jgi:hypothetical protein
MGNALLRFAVRWHARAESISKRAPSTTRWRALQQERELSTTRAIGARRNSGLFSPVCPNVFSCRREIGNVFG